MGGFTSIPSHPKVRSRSHFGPQNQGHSNAYNDVQVKDWSRHIDARLHHTCLGDGIKSRSVGLLPQHVL